MLFAGLLGTLLSFWLLMHAPRELLDFNTAGATNEFLGRLQGVMQSRKAVLEKLSVEPLQLSSTGDPVFLSLLLAVFAGALGERKAGTVLKRQAAGVAGRAGQLLACKAWWGCHCSMVNLVQALPTAAAGQQQAGLEANRQLN